MSFPAKFAVILLCAATCAIGLLPRGYKVEREPSRSSVTPAHLREKQSARWLLV